MKTSTELELCRRAFENLGIAKQNRSNDGSIRKDSESSQINKAFFPVLNQ